MNHPNIAAVTPFPDVTAGRWQVSPAGSKWPLWSRDGRELFYVSGENRALMTVPIESADKAFKWGTARILFPTPYVGFATLTGPRNYDVSPDGRRFLVVKDAPREKAPSLVVVEHWFEELKRLAPPR